MGIKSLVKQVLTEKQNKAYAKCLADKKVSYADWLWEQENIWRFDNMNVTAGNAGGRDKADRKDADKSADFVLLLSGSGELTDYAIKNIACYFMRYAGVQVLYGDEDVKNASGEVSCPWFKPDWSPDFFDSCFYFGSLVAVRRQLWEKGKQVCEGQLGKAWQELFAKKDAGELCAAQAGTASGGTCEIYSVSDLAVYEKWLHLLLEAAYTKQSRMVGHLSQILFHADSGKWQERFLEETDVAREGQDAFATAFWESHAVAQAMEEKAETVSGTNANVSLISVVIPSKDNLQILRQCVEHVFTAGAGIPCEIIIVDNGSNAENKAEIEAWVGRLSTEVSAQNDAVGKRLDVSGANAGGCGESVCASGCSVKYLHQPMEFNFSRMCNLGAEEAKGKLLLFLNDDVELSEPGCIAEMAMRAERSYTGAVGIKLLYPDSARIQHAGITNLPMGPVHKLQFQTDEKDYYGKTNHCSRNFLAVTAACLMVEKEKFTEAGGFSEELRVAFNDVDFCFRLHELGYYNVCLNGLYGYHHESLSRGADESAEKLERLLSERAKLYDRHPALEGVDPYYSVYLNREGLDTLIRPAYETAGNRRQCVSNSLQTIALQDCRQDECLMVRVEECRERRIVGYGIVLGDNNACYEKALLLEKCRKKVANAESDEENLIFVLPLESQYRPDLEENLPDQLNVALSGFWAELKEGTIPEGSYRIGMLARNRVTGLKLVNWSNRCVEL